ncbi:MAG: cobalt ABC transporter, partial [Methanoregula sp.]|nr:cobalt ABC transporter [Methanoregula sp.]
KQEYGISIVIATHDLDLAARIADRVCLVKNGSVFAEGTPDEVFYNPSLIQEAGLALPQTVRIYLDYCKAQGKEPELRPVQREELIRALQSSRS